MSNKKIEQKLSETIGKLELILKKDHESVVKALQYFYFTGVFTIEGTTTVQRYQALSLISELED